MQLKIRDLNKSFSENHVLKDINLDVNSGLIFGYLGRNGAGKTTSIRILMDVFEGDSGSITMDGKKFKPNDYKIGYLPEERGMYSKSKVRDQLIYFAMLRGATKEAASKSMLYWCEKFEIAGYLDQKLETLSKGNQQKVQITQAFINEPDILILDEPFSGLDPVNSSIFQNALLEYIRDDRIIIFSSHQMAYVESFCDEIAIINQGKIVLQGSLKEIRKERGAGKIRLRLNDQNSESFFEDYTYTRDKDDFILELKALETKQDLLKELLAQNIEIESFMDYQPSLQDIFVDEVGEHNETV